MKLLVINKISRKLKMMRFKNAKRRIFKPLSTILQTKSEYGI
jgi:hypothetical protein